MTSSPRRRLRGAVTLAVATLGYALALVLRELVDPWRATALAAVVGIGLSVWALGPRIRALLTITPRGALGAIALGAALVIATHAAFRIAAIEAPALVRSVRALYASVDVGSSRLARGVLTGVVVLGEELVWRGVAIELGAAGRSRAAAGAQSVALYVLPQLAGGVPLLLVAATALGALFAAQRLVTGRLIDPLLTHAVWSIAVFVVFPLV